MKHRSLSLALILTGSIFASSCGDSSSFNGKPDQGKVVSNDAQPSTSTTTKSDTSTTPVTTKPVTDSIVNSEDGIITSEETDALFKNCDTSLSAKIVADLYQLQDGNGSVPDYTTLSPLKKICLNQLDISSRDFTQGFPGVDSLIEWFGLDIHFDIDVKTAGEYLFALTSDDGSIMTIDGIEVITNDGRHGAVRKDALVNLTAGTHKVNIRYFQGPRYALALELKWKIPGATEETYIPVDQISRPK